MSELLAYWRMCEARGDKPKPVFAVFDTVTKELKTFSLSRREMTKWVASLVSPKLYVVAKIEPV
jgi:hypothetical protein